MLVALKLGIKIHSARRLNVMKIFSRIGLLCSLFLVPVLAHAQNGCVNSPECPNAVLGLVGVAGAALYTRFRSR